MLHQARRQARFSGGRRGSRAAHDQEPVAVDHARSPRDATSSTGRSPSAAAGPTSCRRDRVAETRERIDWPQSPACTGGWSSSPLGGCRTHRAVAVAQAGDPAAALRIVDALDRTATSRLPLLIPPRRTGCDASAVATRTAPRTAAAIDLATPPRAAVPDARLEFLTWLSPRPVPVVARA